MCVSQKCLESRCQEGVCKVSDWCLEGVCRGSGRFLEDLWKVSSVVSGGCMECFLKVFGGGKCLESGFLEGV